MSPHEKFYFNCLSEATKVSYNRDHPGKKRYKVKDPTAILSKALGKGKKKVLNAYMLFCNERRAAIQERNPGADFCQMGKLLGAQGVVGAEGETAVIAAYAKADDFEV